MPLGGLSTPDPVVLHADLRERRLDPAGHPEILCIGMLPGVVDCFLGDAEQLGLHVEPESLRALLE
jgi:hypothetical protein